MINKRRHATTKLLWDHPSKAELAKKYKWTERHPENCECVYCVAMQTFSEKHENEQRANAGRDF